MDWIKAGRYAMMVSPNSASTEKRDLHVGGVGSNASAALTTFPQQQIDSADAASPLLQMARGVARDADEYIRGNPWAALGAVAVLGIAAGYLLSRRI